MERHHNYIAGKWAPSRTGNYYQSHNPACPSQILGEFPRSDAADVDAAVASASTARAIWEQIQAPQRAAILLRFSQLLQDSKDELARIITLEQGKALCESAGEVARAAAEAAFAAGEAVRLSGQTFPSERRGFSCYTVLQPVGVVAAITPWNFPVVSPVRKIAPALACGNTVVLKPASLTPRSAVYLASLLEEAGLPPGVLNLVIGSGECGQRLISDTRVRGISFTGSTAVGVCISEQVAARMAKLQLELGGKNPAIVLDCDDLDGAAQEIVAAAFLCSGQRCTALSRVIVQESQADEIRQHLVKHMEKIRVGNGLDPQTTMGPLVSRHQLETVAGYVRKGLNDQSTLVAGGQQLTESPESEGYYYAPTLFDYVSADSALAQEEIFGPVLPMIRVRNAEQALEVANGARYGLAASLFTGNRHLVDKFVQHVESGMVHVNHGTASQAHVPFGGVKDSGLGAFSIGPTAKDAFTNVKAVYIKW
jgi:aldehyde dehydrogenase (NAD+)